MRTHKTLLSTLFIAGLTMSMSIGLTRADDTRSNAREKSPAATQQQGGLLPGETRNQKRERLVKEIEKQVGPLSADQKAHILAVLAAAGDEMAAARGNASLTAEQQNAVVRQVHADVFNRISPALTEAQRSKLQASRSGRSDFSARSNETTQERRARIIKRYEEALPDLTADQKAKINAALDASSAEIKSLRENTSLSEEQRRAAIRKVHSESSIKIDAILTESQRAKWQKAVAERRRLAGREEGGPRAGESREEKRARLLKAYEEVLTDLSIDQKTRILSVMEAAGDEMRAAEGNTTLSDDQKRDAVRRIHAGVGGKIDAILTDAQRMRWQNSQKQQTARSSVGRAEDAKS